MGFHSISEAQRRALVRAINAELSRTSDRQRLLQFARRSLYGHKQVIPRERELRAYIAKAIRQHEATLVREIIEAIDPELLAQWKITIPQQREDGATTQSWLWAPPAKHSTRQIDQVLERIKLLTSLKVDQHLADQTLDGNGIAAGTWQDRYYVAHFEQSASALPLHPVLAAEWFRAAAEAINW